MEAATFNSESARHNSTLLLGQAGQLHPLPQSISLGQMRQPLETNSNMDRSKVVSLREEKMKIWREEAFTVKKLRNLLSPLKLISQHSYQYYDAIQKKRNYQPIN